MTASALPDPSQFIYPVILAAGASSRLGKPKQLLAYRGRSLLQIAFDAAFALGPLAKSNVAVAAPIVVLGANAHAILAATDLHGAEVLNNENWASGMASSIKLAVQHIGMQPGTAGGVILLLADQPHVSEAVLMQLLLRRNDEASMTNEGQTIVASRFSAPQNEGDKGTLGPPVYFGTYYFAALSALEGDVGARKVLQANFSRVQTIDFFSGAIDIDTEDDYKNLMAQADA